jgi:hypothetical protein
MRCSRCSWPSGRPSIATQQPAESFVGYHHIARWFLGGARREHAIAETVVLAAPDTSGSDGRFESGNRLPHRLAHSFDLGVPLRLDLGDHILDQRVGLHRAIRILLSLRRVQRHRRELIVGSAVVTIVPCRRAQTGNTVTKRNGAGRCRRRSLRLLLQGAIDLGNDVGCV